MRKFSLQPALIHKQRLEEVCLMELAEIESAYAREHRILDLLNQLERLGYEDLERQHGFGKIDVGAIGTGFGDLQVLHERIEQQVRLLQDLAEQARRKREELVEIEKEKKTLERLKERQEREWMQAAARVENKLQDELATSQFLRLKTSMASAKVVVESAER